MLQPANIFPGTKATRETTTVRFWLEPRLVRVAHGAGTVGGVLAWQTDSDGFVQR